jgi:hypothetical protein
MKINWNTTPGNRRVDHIEHSFASVKTSQRRWGSRKAHLVHIGLQEGEQEVVGRPRRRRRRGPRLRRADRAAAADEIAGNLEMCMELRLRALVRHLLSLSLSLVLQ